MKGQRQLWENQFKINQEWTDRLVDLAERVSALEVERAFDEGPEDGDIITAYDPEPEQGEEAPLWDQARGTLISTIKRLEADGDFVRNLHQGSVEDAIRFERRFREEKAQLTEADALLEQVVEKTKFSYISLGPIQQEQIRQHLAKKGDAT